MSPEAKSIRKSDGAHQNQVGLMGESEEKKQRTSEHGQDTSFPYGES